MKKQQDQITTLRAQLATAKEVPKTNPLELQERCAEGARKAFKDLGYKPNDIVSYVNHYNAKLNKCFMHVEQTDMKTSPGTIFTNRTLIDAFEGKLYAEYAWHTEKDKKYWEVAPFLCKVLLLSGEEKFCKSNGEYQDLIKTYVEGN
jgi:hypothetical protein